MLNCNHCNVNFNLKGDLFRHFKTKKHQENFNPEQQVLNLKLLEYVHNDDVEGKNGIRINSAGGTGKTYCVSTIMKHVNNAVCLGPTNQSVNILNKQFKGEAQTFHKFFGWETDIDENNKEISIWKVPKIIDGTIFVIDEISMMNQGQFSLFKHYIYDKFKFILMGDRYQLPPIESKTLDTLPLGVELVINKHQDLSLFFQFKCEEISLTQNMRTKDKELNFLISNMRDYVIKNKEINLENNWILDYEFVKQNINRDYIFIAHKNIDVDRFNKEIRAYLNPNSGEIAIGDKIRLKKFYKGLNKETRKTEFLGNGTRYTVQYFQSETKKLFNIFDNDFIEIDVYYIELNDDIVIYKVKDECLDIFENYKKYNCNLIKK